MSNCYYATCLSCGEETDYSLDARHLENFLDTAINDGKYLHHLTSRNRYSLTDHWYYTPSEWLDFVGLHYGHVVHFRAIWSDDEFTIRLGKEKRPADNGA